MTRDDVVLAFRTSLADGGWPVEWADEVADENLEIAAELPAGTIIVRKLESYFLRGALLSLNPWMGRLFDRRVNSENAF